MPVDAKYKKYDEMTVAPGDIYQGFLYGYAYGHHEMEPATAMLIYPTEKASLQRQRLAVRTSDGLQAARLVVLGVPVALLLDELGSDSGIDASTIRSIRGEVGTPEALSRYEMIEH
jgi:hypothetical protein